MTASSVPTSSPEASQPERLADDPGEAARQARAAVQVGVYVSALRCVLTYVVAPALGALGLVLGPFGALLQVLGAITASSGAVRLWRLGHPARYPYALLALALDLMAVLCVGGLLLALLRAVA